MHLGPFGCVMKLGRKWAELVQNFVPRSHVGIFRNERIRSTPSDLKLTFWCVLYYLGVFENRSKRAELVQMFVPRSRFRIFRNERTRSNPLDPKLMFWCISYYLGAFGTVRLPYETQCNTGRTSPKVRATRSRQNYSQRTHPIRPTRP